MDGKITFQANRKRRPRKSDTTSRLANTPKLRHLKACDFHTVNVIDESKSRDLMGWVHYFFNKEHQKEKACKLLCKYAGLPKGTSIVAWSTGLDVDKDRLATAWNEMVDHMRANRIAHSQRCKARSKK